MEWVNSRPITVMYVLDRLQKHFQLTLCKNEKKNCCFSSLLFKNKKGYHLWNNLKIFRMHEMKHNFIEPKNTWQFVRLWDWGFPTIKGTWCEIIHLLVNLPQSLQINSFTRGLNKYIGFKTILKSYFSKWFWSGIDF